MRSIAIGESDFKKIIIHHNLFVDKSLFIKEVIDDPSPALLITRPRRFGKTLNLSMLKYFFDIRDPTNRELFLGLEIWNQDEKYQNHQGRYPVISLTFKDFHYLDWAKTEMALKTLMAQLYGEYLSNLSNPMIKERLLKTITPQEQALSDRILNGTANAVEIMLSLQTLITLLSKLYQQSVILLIDEYDLPIQQGYLNHFYPQIVEFMRVFLGSALKDNPYLEKAVLTGVIRIAKESIFSGLNNLKVCSIFRPEFSSSFGLLPAEVDILLEEYGLLDRKILVKEWYDGYRFGNIDEIYNPWSITNYLGEKQFLPFWVNTSGGDLLRDLLTRSTPTIKEELEDLMAGKNIHINLQDPLKDNLVFNDTLLLPEQLWNLFMASGYLRIQKINEKGVDATVPNREVKLVYDAIIRGWFINPQGMSIDRILKHLVEGNLQQFAEGFQQLVLASFSQFDVGSSTAENFYHAFTLGLLIRLSDQFEVTSNRESGLGRYDLCLFPLMASRPGFIIEFKIHNPKRERKFDQTADRALNQTETQQYSTIFRGKNVSTLFVVAIVFHGKKVNVKYRTLSLS